jgi:hypothetical protein
MLKHSLTNKDKAELVADCAVCGPRVPIRLNGRYGIVCLEARRERSRRYKQQNPEKVKAAKAASNPSTHRLSLRNGELDTCVVCGEVQPVQWGRGWMCPTIPKEKGWVVTDVVNVRPRQIDPALRAEIYAAGMHIENGETSLACDAENAIPGWKTLGSTEPAVRVGGFPVRPEYAVLYGSGSHR